MKLVTIDVEAAGRRGGLADSQAQKTARQANAAKARAARLRRITDNKLAHSKDNANTPDCG